MTLLTAIPGPSISIYIYMSVSECARMREEEIFFVFVVGHMLLASQNDDDNDNSTFEIIDFMVGSS